MITKIGLGIGRAHSAGLARPKLVILVALFATFLAVAVPFVVMFAEHRTLPNRNAQSGSLQLKAGIATYFTEYRKFPTRLTGPEDSDQPEFSDRILMKLLTGNSEPEEPGMSPRNISFVSFKPAMRTETGTLYGGISTDANGDSDLWDPWGNHYRVVMDTNGDGVIPAPSFDSVGAPIKNGVIVWSPGPDGDDATVEDNVLTWLP